MTSRALDDDRIREIVDNVSRALADELSSITLPPPELRTPPSLVVSLRGVSGAANQADALESLLAGATSFGARAALFVVREGAAHGWRGEGFGSREDGSDPVSGAVLSVDEPAVRAAIEGEAVSCGGADPEHGRVPDFGQGEVVEARLEPIRVRDKVLGLLYADRTAEESGWDPVAIEALARVTELAVERLALSRPRPRRTAAEGQREPGAARSHPAAATAAPAPEGPPPATPARTEPGGSGERNDDGDDATREDARRFARLLMEELLLYYESDVEAGRAAHDLEQRLGDRIDEARNMFQQRYATVLDEPEAVFREAMVEVLAAGHPEVLGSSSSATP